MANARVMSVPRWPVRVVAGLGYAWILSSVRTFTRPAAVLTGIPLVVVAIVLVVRYQGPRTPDDRRPARWLAGWATLELAWFAWEMRELFASPRHDYPTLSSIGDAALRSSHLAHAAAVALWLAAGAYLCRAARSRVVP